MEYAAQNNCVVPIHRPNLKEKLFFLFSGMVMSVPLTLFVEASSEDFLKTALAPSYALFFAVAIIAPLVEEFAKSYPLFYRHGETQRSLIALGFYTGLGFGIMEFLFYAFFLHAPIVIRLFAIIFHATNTSIVAYGIAKKHPWQFYTLAVLFHFLNNFSALFGNIWFFIGIPAVFLSFFLALILRYRALEKPIDF